MIIIDKKIPGFSYRHLLKMVMKFITRLRRQPTITVLTKVKDLSSIIIQSLCVSLQKQRNHRVWK